MHSFTNTIIAASAFIASVSGSPIQARAMCGSAPSGSTSQTPLSQPTGITTASACQASCEANASCQSFVFGMVSSVDECILYSVAASSVPKQSSTNLIVYDKACTSVPAVVPTANNPTGAATSTSSNTGTSTSNSGTSNSNTGAGSQGQKLKLARRQTCGGTASATTAQAVLQQPTGITTAEQCQAKCDANTSCQSFVFGMASGVNQCMLYSVAASAVPTQTSSNLVVYDKACASVPTQTPTASNPTGANTGSTASTGSNTSTGSNAGSNPAQNGNAGH